MSAISPPAYGKKERTEEYVVAVRRDMPASGHGPRGSLHCVSCGASTISHNDFARYAGVSTYHLVQWLNKRPIREDVAARIRAKLLRVDE